MHIAVVYIEFEHPTYTALESDSSIEVCIKLFDISYDYFHVLDIYSVGVTAGKFSSCYHNYACMHVFAFSCHNNEPKDLRIT